jgi:hypothetical protein
MLFVGALNHAERVLARRHVIDFVEHQLGWLAEMHEEQQLGGGRKQQRHLERGQALQPPDQRFHSPPLH